MAPARLDVHLGTLIFYRQGGDAPEDLAFREDLYQVVGSITVAGGHIEASLKRHLLVLTSTSTDFTLVDHTWSDLEKKLRKACDTGVPRQQSLLRLMDWADKHKLLEQRHTVVHGLWNLYAGHGARVGRWPRGESERILLGDLDHFKHLNMRCWSYATRLRELLANDWPHARLDPLLPPATFGRVEPSG